MRGSILHILSQNYEEGKKYSKYFFSLEKRRSKQKTITKLKTANGHEITNQEEILKECRLFYEKLYTNDETVCPEAFSFFIRILTSQS